MIFVTVGTEKFPFDRLLKTIDQAKADNKISGEVILQTGTSSYKAKSCRQKDFFSFDEMVRHIREADIVVAHAGIGTTLLNLSLGKIPILFPRRFDLGEHLDDHQMDFAKKIETTGKVLVAYDEPQLFEAIEHYSNKIKSLAHSVSSKNRASLVNTLTAYLENK